MPFGQVSKAALRIVVCHLGNRVAKDSVPIGHTENGNEEVKTDDIKRI